MAITTLPCSMAMWTTVGLFAVPVESVASESWGYDLKHELMSPFCPGRTLASCPSPQAAELSQWIVMQEAAGVTREQVLEILIERFGEEILGAPPARGITLWAYIFPVMGFVLGGALAFLALRRIVVGQGSASGAGAAAVRLSPEPALATLTSMGGVSTEGASTNPASPARATHDELARIVDQELGRRE